MKLFSLAAGALALLLTGCGRVTAEPPITTNQPAPRLTVELRDGSRVIGQSVGDFMKFRSALLGNLKLAVTNIRTLEFTATNAAKLTTANGDMLVVQAVSEKLPLHTSFGPVNLAMDSIRRLFVSPSSNPAQRRPGLVALWSGEDNGDDSIGGNNAKLEDVSFADGKVGRAFAFNGTSSYISIPSNPALDVGMGDGFTISAWIKPADINGLHPILEWQPGGVQFWIGQNPSSRGVLCGFFMDTNGNHYTQVPSPSGTLMANTWQFIAMTYDRPSGIVNLYVNGSIVAQQQWGSFIPRTQGGLSSFRPSNPGDWTYNRYFSGVMDELAIYNRALSATEIQTIATEENHGEALPPPAVQSNFSRPDGRF